ncbi:hypothetical protein LRS06_05830 [Hymenobacter sp. J193]|uniref:hypothetical protein n=1 Tax=Hymenobacter sp. J193 TaxID=2898429 RepID=UPI002151A4E5|nr:hypothetical protein [Hymenobacter sp. J193]MCR5887306.1 hypothetical protein [Hymenobacter sp. J193]
MHKYLLTLIACAICLTSYGQSASSPSPPPRLSPLQQDTVRALNNMYNTRRRAGKIWLGIAASSSLVFVRVLTETRTTPNGPVVKEQPVGLYLVFAAISGGLATVAINKLAGTSKARQQEVSDTYFTTLKMPNSVRRRIKKKYF